MWLLTGKTLYFFTVLLSGSGSKLRRAFPMHYSFISDFAIFVIKGTTTAFPIQKYRILFGIPVFVHSSGNPFSRSHSSGVNVLNRPVTKS